MDKPFFIAKDVPLQSSPKNTKHRCTCIPQRRFTHVMLHLMRAFREIPHTICYSVKANSNLSILRLLARKGCGFDVVSGGELERVLIGERKAREEGRVFRRRQDARRTCCRTESRDSALQHRERIRTLGPGGVCSASSEVCVRSRCASIPMLPPRPILTSRPACTNTSSVFPSEKQEGLYAKAAVSKCLQPRGVSVHIGSQITDATPFGEAMSRVAELVRELRGDGHRIDYVDAGGGLGISYEKSDSSDFPTRVDGYANQLTTPLRDLNIHLLLEPGRSIVGPAGILLTKVVYKKSNNGKCFLIVDAAMNDLIRPALYGAHHEIVPVAESTATKTETTDIVGPVCETGDFFARDRVLPEVKEGDLLAILDAGAYGMVLASNYNTRPRPAEILVSGKSAKVIRRREKISNLLRAER